jgi:hypothetical protein
MNAMNGHRKHFSLLKHSVFGARTLVFVVIVCCTSLMQCNEADVDDAQPAPRVNRTIDHDGYAIPLFSTAEEQFRHALGWFSDLNEKKASLEVVIDTFPEAKTVHAEARLELAYLALGRDYRYSSPAQCHAAIGKYHFILSEFSDLPVICAEANWYIGWILADLLDEPGKAVAYYQTVVADYPDATLNLRVAVPWVKLVLPLKKKRPQDENEHPTRYWSSMALLELVRISGTEAGQWSAFEALYADHRSSPATGYAMRILLYGSPSLQRQTAAYAKQHLVAGMFSGDVARQIRERLNNAGLLDDQSQKEPAPGVR